MSIYIILYFVILFFAILFLFIQNKSLEKRIGIVLCIVLFLGAGFRYKVGPDYAEYVKIYQKVPALNCIHSLDQLKNIHGEYGFLFLNSILKYFHCSSQWIFIIIAGMTLFVLYICCRTNNLYCLPIYIYVSNFYLRETMGQIRFGLASLICLYAVKYLQSDRKKFIFLVLLASFFQKASLIFLILVFIKKFIRKRNNSKKYLMIFIGIFVIHFIPRQVKLNIIKCVSYSFYLKIISSNYTGKVYFSIYQLYLVILFCILLKIIHKIRKREIVEYINISLIGILMYFLFLDFSIYAARFSDNLFKVNIFMFPYLFFYIKNKRTKFSILCFIIIICFYFYFFILFKVGELYYIPYGTIFF